MKTFIIISLILSNTCFGQEWVAEVTLGAAAYNGDLTQQRISIKTMRPGVSFNLKYNSGDFINFRAGIGYWSLLGNDKFNSEPDLKARNLNFKTSLIEANVCAEIILADPEIYFSYPYILAGVGAFHFNPYTYDQNNTKTFLQPLSTEGEGLNRYRDRKKYSLIQVCFPVGFGWKFNFREKWEISYEFGYRFLLTDYLDDVSETYPNLDVLAQEKGPKSAELSYRKQGVPFQEEGQARGNPKIKDSYFFSGIKLGLNLTRYRNRD
jgi:hypothetical protein